MSFDSFDPPLDPRYLFRRSVPGLGINNNPSIPGANNPSVLQPYNPSASAIAPGGAFGQPAPPSDSNAPNVMQTPSSAPQTSNLPANPQPVPQPDAPKPSLFDTMKTDFSAGNYGKGIGAALSNKDVMGGLATMMKGATGGGEQQPMPAAPPPPNIDTNSAAIAQMAPQMMAGVMAGRRKVPGTSISGLPQQMGGPGGFNLYSGLYGGIGG